MADFNWKALVGTVAPTLATTFLGPLGGMAVKAVGDALGMDSATEQDISARLQGAKPEDLLALKNADNAFKTKMAELGVDLEKIAAADRDSARQMQTTTRSNVPAFLATVVTCGFFGILVAMMVGDFHPENNDALLLMLGSLGTAWGSIIAFYFGSSSSSKQKDETISSMAKG